MTPGETLVSMTQETLVVSGLMFTPAKRVVREQRPKHWPYVSIFENDVEGSVVALVLIIPPWGKAARWSCQWDGHSSYGKPSPEEAVSALVEILSKRADRQRLNAENAARALKKTEHVLLRFSSPEKLSSS